jgi:nicotinic acid mononucleotide adenylyltransferase
VDALRTAWDELDPHGAAVLRWLRPAPGAGVVLLLGAFDPPTRAHVELLAGSAAALGLPGAFCMTKVLLDRPSVLLDGARRLELLDGLASDSGAGLAIANRGTYLDVARAAGAAGVEATFVVGSDKLDQLADPSFYAEGASDVDATFAQVRFVVVERAGSPVRRPGLRVFAASDVFTDPAVASISATQVRERLRSGLDVADLVPPAVAEALAGYTSTHPSRER